MFVLFLHTLSVAKGVPWSSFLFFPGDQTWFSSKSRLLPLLQTAIISLLSFFQFGVWKSLLSPLHKGCLYSSPLLPICTIPSGFMHLEELTELKLKLGLYPHSMKSSAKQYSSASCKASGTSRGKSLCRLQILLCDGIDTLQILLYRLTVDISMGNVAPSKLSISQPTCRTCAA